MACGGEEGGVRVELGQVHLGGGEEPAQDVGRVCQQEQDGEYCLEAWGRGHAGRLEFPTVRWKEDGNIYQGTLPRAIVTALPPD